MKSLCLAALALAAGTAVAAPVQTFHLVDATASQARVTILLNGVEIMVLDPTAAQHGVSTSGSIDLWLVPGKNKITALVDKPTDKAAFLPAKASAKVEHRFGVGNGKTQKEAAEVVVKTTAGAFPVKLPSKSEKSFDAKDVPAMEMWTKATRMKLDQDVKVKVSALVISLRDAFARRDVDAIAKLWRFKDADTARSLGKPVDPQQAELRKNVEDLRKSAKWTVAPLANGDLRIRLMGDGRILVVDRLDRAPVVKADAGDGAVEVPVLYVALIDGAWTIVR